MLLTALNNLSVNREKLPASGLLPHVSRVCLQEWQNIWNNWMRNKLCRHEEVICVKKNYCFKHSYKADNDIVHRKQQKLAYHIFTCKFPVSCITMYNVIRSWHCHVEGAKQSANCVRSCGHFCVSNMAAGRHLGFVDY